jgi:hypothetical protein
VPQGIFPPPNDKRSLQLSNIEDDTTNVHPNSGDVINQFEKEPYKVMIRKELERSSYLGPVTPEISFMTNL